VASLLLIFFTCMAEVLAIGFVKDELLKAAARKREQARSVRLGLFERPGESKSSPQDKEKSSR